MEGAGFCWVPLYEVLDGCGFEVWLVNPAGQARPDLRKSDVLDCQWLRQLMSLGLLKRSHRPEDAICGLRACFVQRMQKALHQMNVQLDSMVSDIAGKTGWRLSVPSATACRWRSYGTRGLKPAPRRPPRGASGQLARSAFERSARCVDCNRILTHFERDFNLHDSLECCRRLSAQLARKEFGILSLAARLTAAADVSESGGRSANKHPRRRGGATYASASGRFSEPI